jgi:DNA-binding NtrC family response regulator
MERCRLASDVPLGELLAALDACRGDLRATAERLAVSSSGLKARLRASGLETQDAAHDAG